LGGKEKKGREGGAEGKGKEGRKVETPPLQFLRRPLASLRL